MQVKRTRPAGSARAVTSLPQLVSLFANRCPGARYLVLLLRARRSPPPWLRQSVDMWISQLASSGERLSPPVARRLWSVVLAWGLEVTPQARTKIKRGGGIGH